MDFDGTTLSCTADSGGGGGLWATNGSVIYNGTTAGVGIGTASPGRPLEVKSATGSNARIRIVETADHTSNQYAGIELYNNTDFKGAFVKKGDDDAIQIWDGSAARITIEQGGKVGIGTDSSDYQLTIGDGSSTSVGRIKLHGNGPLIVFNNSAAGYERKIIIQQYQNRTRFYDLTGGSELMALTNDGNVGIGTAAPSEKLHVAGNIKQGNMIREVYTQYTSDSSNALLLLLNMTDEGSNDGGYLFGHISTYYYIASNSKGSVDFWISYSSEASPKSVKWGYETHGGPITLNLNNASDDLYYLNIHSDWWVMASVQIEYWNSNDHDNVWDTSVKSSTSYTSGSDFPVNSNVYIPTNVGIGTTSPGEKLEVNGNISQGDYDKHIFGAGDDAEIYWDNSNSRLVIKVS